ncbi:MAG: zf-TFIIB domain-containing protein [Leptospiraceae bacterium]|nr:zf-TFIIB domain-containing protein [Leptospiraceae bacterium]MBK9500784.1 zf-TFIIB domain-containing protein [Leptospiraceae bacterium]MBP9163330.1 zf-TFIIB domain-containing protein [Leptospiraceae bacterium]
MNCPKCKIGLRSETIAGLQTDFCSRCAGVWLDSCELSKILGVNSDLPEQIIKSELKSTSLNCPRCENKKMDRFVYHPEARIILEKCPSCEGLWLDKGEFGLIQGLLKKWEKKTTLTKKANSNYVSPKDNTKFIIHIKKEDTIEQPLPTTIEEPITKNQSSPEDKQTVNNVKIPAPFFQSVLWEIIKPLFIYFVSILFIILFADTKNAIVKNPCLYWWFYLLGFVLSPLAAYSYMKNASFVLNGCLAKGRVIDYIVTNSISKPSDSMYKAIIQYYDEEGMLHQFTDPIAISYSVRISGEVNVYYDPKNPENAKLRNWSSLWGLFYGFGYLGFACIYTAPLMQSHCK